MQHRDLIQKRYHADDMIESIYRLERLMNQMHLECKLIQCVNVLTDCFTHHSLTGSVPRRACDTICQTSASSMSYEGHLKLCDIRCLWPFMVAMARRTNNATGRQRSVIGVNIKDQKEDLKISHPSSVIRKIKCHEWSLIKITFPSIRPFHVHQTHCLQNFSSLMCCTVHK